MLFAAIASIAAPVAFAHDAAVESTIKAMAAGFNKGDIAAVKAQHVASPTIVDNVPPFAWTGPNAFDTGVADLGKSDESGPGSISQPASEAFAAKNCTWPDSLSEWKVDSDPSSASCGMVVTVVPTLAAFVCLVDYQFAG